MGTREHVIRPPKPHPLEDSVPVQPRLRRRAERDGTRSGGGGALKGEPNARGARAWGSTFRAGRSSRRGPTRHRRRPRGLGPIHLGAGCEVIAVDAHVHPVIDDQGGRGDRRRLGGQVQMGEDPSHHERIGETREDLPPSPATRTPEHIHEEDPSEELRPGEPSAATAPGAGAGCPCGSRGPTG